MATSSLRSSFVTRESLTVVTWELLLPSYFLNLDEC